VAQHDATAAALATANALACSPSSRLIADGQRASLAPDRRDPVEVGLA
jgi:hypothetical protein